MKTVKQIVSDLKKEGATIVKGCTVLDVYVGEVHPELGVCNVVLNLDKDVPGMVQVTNRYIEELEVNLQNLQDKLDISTDDEEKVILTEKIKALKADIDNLEIDDWVKGTVNRIFISNFDVIGMLRQNPDTRFLIDAVQADETIIKDLLNRAVVNVIAEDVTEGEEYIKPFSNNSTSYPVPHDSVYHTCYGLALSHYGEDAANNIRQIMNEITRERIMNKLRARTAKRTTTIDFNDDED